MMPKCLTSLRLHTVQLGDLDRISQLSALDLWWKVGLMKYCLGWLLTHRVHRRRHIASSREDRLYHNCSDFLFPASPPREGSLRTGLIRKHDTLFPLYSVQLMDGQSRLAAIHTVNPQKAFPDNSL